MGEYKIAVLDVETTPFEGFSWGKFEQTIIEFTRYQVIMSFAVKWVGDKGPPTCIALPDFKKTYKNDPFDDTEVTRVLFDVLSEADLLVGHNLDRFDLRKINARLIKNGSHPPSPYKTFDTLKAARRHFNFPSNKLGDLATYLDCPYGGKIQHEGFGLWGKCMNGDLAAWARMMKYNVQDVRINEWLYHKLAPWSRHPNITLTGNVSNACPACGSRKVEQRGWNNMQSYRTKRFRCCAPRCGKWSSGAREKLPIQVLT